MGKYLVRALICAITAAGLAACSGGGGSCDAPAVDATGTWCITITGTSGTCGNQSNTPPYPADFTQNGNSVSATSQGATYAGTICGSTATMSASNFGYNTTVSVTFSDANTASGASTYSNATCSGRDTFTAVRGACL